MYTDEYKQEFYRYVEQSGGVGALNITQLAKGFGVNRETARDWLVKKYGNECVTMKYSVHNNNTPKGRSYKEVVSMAKWGIIEHFLATVLWADRRARMEGMSLNLTRMMACYRNNRGVLCEEEQEML